jgi:hypothetical protein
LASPEPTIRAVVGPLDEDGLRDVARLYGPVDAKYTRAPFLDNLLCAGPAGPALHVFADAADVPVGHCCVVPQPARRGDEALLAGKVEAFVVDERFREVLHGGTPLAIAVLNRLYHLSDERGIDVLHAYATRELGLLHRLLGFRSVEVGEPTLVSLFPRAELRRRRLPELTLAVAQAGTRAAARRLANVRVRPPEATDGDLAETPPAADAWTVPGEAVWDWYMRSSLLRVVEAEGRRGFRALIQSGAPGGGIQLLSWRPTSAGGAAGLAALAACSHIASRERASAFRYQPWSSAGGNGGLRRAGRLLGLVPHRDMTTLYVRSKRPELTAPGAVALTPFFYATF